MTDWSGLAEVPVGGVEAVSSVGGYVGLSNSEHLETVNQCLQSEGRGYSYAPVEVEPGDYTGSINGSGVYALRKRGDAWFYMVKSK